LRAYQVRVRDEGGIKMSTTYKPHNLKNKRKKGFLARMSSKNGRKVINNRRKKGRKRLVCV